MLPQHIAEASLPGPVLVMIGVAAEAVAPSAAAPASAAAP
jgi:hypothetical protein